MLKNSKVAFFSVTDTYYKRSIIKNVFLKLRTNSCFCLKQADEREISQIKVLAIPFLLGFSSYFSQGEIEIQLKICIRNSNSVLGKNKTLRCLLPANIIFISVFYLKVLAEFFLKSTQFAYLHRNLMAGVTL